MTTEDLGLDRLACLAGRSWHAVDLPGGLTNHNVRVRTDDSGEPLDLVVRCTQSDADLLGIDRDTEEHNTRAAAAAGVGAAVVEYRPDLRMLVIEHLPGTALVDADLADPITLTRAADAVRRLHAGPAFTGVFDMFARQAAYRSTVAAHGFRLPASYDDHAGTWTDVRSALEAAPRPPVPCNNDLLASNFIQDVAAGTVWLIDYEYSGSGDAAFELGNTATECGFTDDQTQAWAEAYYGAPTPADLARVRVQAACSAYGWSLWGFIQAASSPLDFDFYDWGVERFEKAAAAFAAPRLRHDLEEIARG